jgi:hypothetical protein
VKNTFFLGLIFYPLILFSNELTILGSDNVDYDGQTMVLSGGVDLENDFGKIKANEVILCPADKESKLRFRSVKLVGDVQFTIKGNGTISCEEALMDFIKKEGAFLGKDQDSYVIYSETLKGGTPVEVRGHKMTFEMVSESDGEFGMKRILVDDDVTIGYKDNLIVAGDSGIYDCQSFIFTLRTNGEERECTVRNPTGDFNLKCPGEIIVDKKNHRITLTNNESNPEKQIFYFDGLGRAFANHVVLEYTESMEPNKLSLAGGVKIMNREGVLTQYIMADRAEYLFDSLQMLITADKGNRVILFDRPNNLQVSAPGLKITKNQETKKESIQGIGDVRFQLVEEELELLRKSFHLEKNQLE